MTRGKGGGSLMLPAWPCSEGAGAGESDCQGVEATYPLVLAQNGHPDRPIPRICREAAQHMDREAGHKRYGGTRVGQTPGGRQGPGCRTRAAKGGQTEVEYSGRLRHVAWGAETIVGGWQVAGVGDV